MWIFVRVTNERKGTSQVRSKELEGNGLLKVRFFGLSGERRILRISSILYRGFEWFADLPKAALFFDLSVISGRRLPGCRYHTLKSLHPSTSPGFLGFRISSVSAATVPITFSYLPTDHLVDLALGIPLQWEPGKSYTHLSSLIEIPSWTWILAPSPLITLAFKRPPP